MVFAANTLDDSVPLIDVQAGAVVATISLGPTPPLTPEDIGERLFYDATLSHEGWMSCQSCHTDGHASLVKADTLGDGSYGAPKRTLSLLGIADTAPYAWDGSVKSLDEQVRKSFQTTLRGKTPPDEQVRAVSSYLRTLASPPPLADGEHFERPPRPGGFPPPQVRCLPRPADVYLDQIVRCRLRRRGWQPSLQPSLPPRHLPARSVVS